MTAVAERAGRPTGRATGPGTGSGVARGTGPGSDRRTRRAAVLAVVLALAGLVAGCAQLPVSGPVHQGRTAAPAADAIRIEASRPGPGDGPQEIVQGFLAAGPAGLSADGDFEVARSYLTTSAGAQWSPLAEVVIARNDEPQSFRVDDQDAAIEDATDSATDDVDNDGDGDVDGAGAATSATGSGTDGTDDGEPAPVTPAPDTDGTGAPGGGGADGAGSAATAGDRVTVTLAVVAAGDLDPGGVYSVSESPGTSELAFGLVRVEGEWRIETLPQGLLLTEFQFSQVFRAVPLQFLTPDAASFVPDVRYVPVRNSASYAVTLLLGGPAPWLAPAVVTRIPTEASLEQGRSVAVADDGSVEVHLAQSAADVPAASRDLAVAQIEETLLGVPGVRDVTVWLAGTPYEPAADAPTPSLGADVGDVLVGVGEEGLVVVTDDDVVPWVAWASGVAADDAPAVTGLTDPAPAYDPAAGLAALAGSSLVHVAPDGAVTELLALTDPLPPSQDPLGWVWTGDRGAADLRAVGPDGQVVTVAADGLAQLSPRQVRLSREGARAVVLGESDGRAVLVAASVVRGGDGEPTRLVLGPTLAAFAGGLDVAWADPTTVAALVTQDASAAPLVRSVTVGGPSAVVSSTPQAVTLAAGEGVSHLFVGTADGRLLVRVSLRWDEVTTGVGEPAFPG